MIQSEDVWQLQTPVSTGNLTFNMMIRLTKGNGRLGEDIGLGHRCQRGDSNFLLHTDVNDSDYTTVYS